MLAFGFTSCSSLFYQSDHLVDIDPQDFSTYYTEVQCDDDVNPIVADKILRAIEKNAGKIGYQLAPNGDLLVKYLIKNTSTSFQEECIDEYQRFGGGEICRERVVTYKEGSLIMDIIDSNTQEIIWHGAAYGPSFNEWEHNDDRITAMVDNLFDRYYAPSK